METASAEPPAPFAAMPDSDDHIWDASEFAWDPAQLVATAVSNKPRRGRPQSEWLWGRGERRAASAAPTGRWGHALSNPLTPSSGIPPPACFPSQKRLTTAKSATPTSPAADPTTR